MSDDLMEKISKHSKFEGLLSHDETARILGIKSQTLYNWRCERKGPDYVLMGRRVMYRPPDVHAFIDKSVVRLNAV